MYKSHLYITDNVMTFLQENELDEPYNLRRVGRLIYRQTVRLDQDKSLNLHQWQNFSIDLKNLFREERGAIYNIRLSFRKAYSLYDKTKVGDIKPVSGITEADRDEWDKEYAYISRQAADYTTHYYTKDLQIYLFRYNNAHYPLDYLLSNLQ